MAQRNKGGNARKYGRNKDWCKAYRARGQREVNKRKKAERRARIEAKHSRKRARRAADGNRHTSLAQT